MKKINWKKLGHTIVAFLASRLLLLVDALSDLFARRADAKQRENAGARLTVWVSVFALTVAALVACFPVRPNYSELEQRSLTAFPSFQLSDFLDGEYFEGVSTWFSDTFPFREALVKLSTGFQQLYGFQSTTVVGSVETGDAIPTALIDQTEDGTDQTTEPNDQTDTPDDQTDTPDDQTTEPDASDLTPEEQDTQSETPETNGGQTGASSKKDDDTGNSDATGDDDLTTVSVEALDALLVIDDAAYEYYNFRQAASEDYIRAINKVASQLQGIATVYDMIVPTSIDICVPESIREGVNTSDQRKALDYFYASLSSSVQTIDVYDRFVEREAAGDYLYFRTDHHWTALAAYYAYALFTETAGVNTASLETDFTEHVYSGFLGSFYRKTNSFAMAANPDTVYAYEPVDTNTMTITAEAGQSFDYEIITDVDGWSSSSKYASCFIGGDQPYSVIVNPNIEDDSSIVLIKESYGNCFAPFLVESYHTVYIVDYRYYNDACEGTLADLVKEHGIQDVLFLNTISSTRSELLVGELTDLIEGQ